MVITQSTRSAASTKENEQTREDILAKSITIERSTEMESPRVTEELSSKDKSHKSTSDGKWEPALKQVDIEKNLLQNGTAEEIEQLIENHKPYVRDNDFSVEFYDLTMSTEVPVKHEIFSISSIFYSVFCLWKRLHQETKEIHVISNLTGRILPRKMTLLIGPPGSGKSVLLKALAGRLRPLGGAKISGDVYYDGDNIKSGKFLVGKVSDYIEQGDTHNAVLTVEETLKFAWQCTTGGHHAYGRAKDEESAAILNKDDENMMIVNNILTGLGLRGCKDTYVGDQMIRGVSGGQKKRVTIGEIAAIPRPVNSMFV